MLGRLRKLAWGVGPGVAAGGLSWLAIFCAVLISVLAACFWSAPLPLQEARSVTRQMLQTLLMSRTCLI